MLTTTACGEGVGVAAAHAAATGAPSREMASDPHAVADVRRAASAPGAAVGTRARWSTTGLPPSCNRVFRSPPGARPRQTVSSTLARPRMLSVPVRGTLDTVALYARALRDLHSQLADPRSRPQRAVACG